MIQIRDIAGTGRDVACRKAIIKLGSNVVIGKDNEADLAVINGLADSIAELRRQKLDVIIVTSGAVGLGCNRMGVAKPKTLPEKQAMAAIGQISLMHIYQGALAERGLAAAQALLTRGDMEDRQRYLNARHALERLLSLGAVPIINENDTVSTAELSFGDNDVLSAYVAVKLKADLLILLSSVEGVMKAPPRGAEKGELIPVIAKIDAASFGVADDSRSGHGSGGMRSKLQAAKTAVDAGVHAVIACGKTPGILRDIFSGRFKGTYLPAAEGSSMSALERWIGFGRSPKGRRLTLDEGAVEALLRKKKSLLPVGVVGVAGGFEKGDIVDVCDRRGEVIARGVVNYSADEVERIKGRKTGEIEGILGLRNYDEIIHRDNLAILQKA